MAAGRVRSSALVRAPRVEYRTCREMSSEIFKPVPETEGLPHPHRGPRQPGEGVLNPTATSRRLSPPYRDVPARYGAVALTCRVREDPRPGTEIHLVEAQPEDRRLRAHAQRIGRAHRQVPASYRQRGAGRSRPRGSARPEDKSKNWRFSTSTFAVRSALQPRCSLGRGGRPGPGAYN